MKKILFPLLLASAPMAGLQAQTPEEEFKKFTHEQEASYQEFVDKANREYLEFMRKTWRKNDAEKPVQKRIKPEPVKPVRFDTQKEPKQKPVCLSVESIEQILGATTDEGKQKPTIKVDDVETIIFDKPVVIGGKEKKKPTVTIVEEVVPATPVVEQPEVKQPEVKQPEMKQPEMKQPEVKQPEIVVKQPEPKPVVQPAPASVVMPDTPLYTGGSQRTRVDFFSEPLYVSTQLKGGCHVRGNDEKALADAYEALCSANYKPLLVDLRFAVRDRNLNDWGLYQLVVAVADEFTSDQPSSIVMQQFLLNQLGIKARMARQAGNGRMLIFVATAQKIYGHPYIKKDGLNYYNLNGTQSCQFYMCEKDSPYARNPLQMSLSGAPRFPGDTKNSVRQSKDGVVKTVTDVPRELIDFYKSFPQCDYSVYATAPMNPQLEAQLFAALRPLVQGKSEVEAANLLINYVQTGFDYATDQQQFGYEKPFFPEETLFYPQCDCEDRSIFFSYLVRKLLGLDVALLDYPDHIATAVRFTQPVEGDYLMVDGQRYTVCDPTYIGAEIGHAMPQYKSVRAKVLKY